MSATERNPQRGELLSEGKAKTLYATDDPRLLVMHFRDDTTAFDGAKRASLAGKGEINNRFNAFIMQQLAQAGVPTHFERLLASQDSAVRRLDMLAVEFVVRNIAAGSLCKRLGFEAGATLDPPLQELFLKDDALGDPLINEQHAIRLGLATMEQLQRGAELALRVNEILAPLMAEAGMLLVDYKLEFGMAGDELLLGDEFTPDGCRLWDTKSRESLDKDRFRQDLGNIVESYRIAAARLGVEGATA